MSSCECSEPGFCPRHKCNKTAHLHHLCKTRRDYFELWERGFGPGQLHTEQSHDWVAPVRDLALSKKPWQGPPCRKPWSYTVTAVVPVLDTIETIPTVVELLRLQTEKPFIILIDTGSTEENLATIQKMRSHDVEVHSLRVHGVRHPSDFPAMAMDLAFAICRTRYMFATHADCFLMRQNVLEELLELCRTQSPVVGHQLSPRKHDDWKWMVGHTCLMLDMFVMDEIGAGWSMRRLSRRYGLEDYAPDPMRPSWPDTEMLLNYTLREHGIDPHFTGTEENNVRNQDGYIDHCRSLTAGLLYSPNYYAKARGWAIDAIEKAKLRIADWKTSSRRPAQKPPSR